MVPRSTRKQVAMIQDETQKDQKPEEVPISFSLYLKSRTDKAEVLTTKAENRDSRRTIEQEGSTRHVDQSILAHMSESRRAR